MKTILLGVTGASSSGKSTVACLLKEILPQCHIIHEDDFFKPEKDVPFDESRGDYDWDCPDAIDFDSLIQTITVLKNRDLASQNPRAVVRLADHGYYEYDMESTEPPRNDVNFMNSDNLLDTLKKQVLQKINSEAITEEIRIFLIDGFLILHNETLLDLLDATLFFKTNYQTLKERREKRLYTVEGNVWVDPPGYFDTFVWPGYYKYHKSSFVNGQNEEEVKKTGGEVKPDLCKQYHILEFSNDNNCNADILLETVVKKITEELF